MVKVGSDPNRNNTVCGTVTQAKISASKRIDIPCFSGALEGRYLSIELPDDRAHALTVCEVEAYSGESCECLSSKFSYQ